MMRRNLLVLVVGLTAFSVADAQTMRLLFSSDDFVVTSVFNDVTEFSFDIRIDAPLAPGVYANPDISTVLYRVSGNLPVNTPSGFPAFALERSITGDDFYAQGSSLSFEISAGAVTSDGIQVAELVGNGIVFTFNGKEIDNGRFHPALLELNDDGTGLLQNSDNIVVANPLQQVTFGEEYITDLVFDPGNLTLLTAITTTPPPVRSSGGGAMSVQVLILLLLLTLIARRPRLN